MPINRISHLFEQRKLPYTNRLPLYMGSFNGKDCFSGFSSKEEKDLETICSGRVIPTEPDYIKYITDKKRKEVLNIAQASASYQKSSEFTLAHLLLASSYKDEELIKLIYKNGLGVESVAHQLGVPLVISMPRKEIQPDEVCKWIINHSVENKISIFESICHFICDAWQIQKHGVEPDIIVESIKNPYEDKSILWIDSVPSHMRNN